MAFKESDIYHEDHAAGDKVESHEAPPSTHVPLLVKQEVINRGTGTKLDAL